MEDSPKMALAFLLSTHLQFGNARQIECLELLRFAEELLEGPPRQCGECDGKGTVDQVFRSNAPIYRVRIRAYRSFLKPLERHDRLQGLELVPPWRSGALFYMLER